MSLDSATTPIKDTINDASTQNSLFEMTNKSKKLAEHDALYMAEQRRQDIFYAQYENQCTEEIPLIDENILFNLERRKKKDICRHCKGKMANGDIRSHLAICPEAKAALEKLRQKIIDLGQGSSNGPRHNVSVATSSVEKNKNSDDQSTSKQPPKSKESIDQATKLKCKECSRVCKSEKGLKAHVTRTHSKKKIKEKSAAKSKKDSSFESDDVSDTDPSKDLRPAFRQTVSAFFA